MLAVNNPGLIGPKSESETQNAHRTDRLVFVTTRWVHKENVWNTATRLGHPEYTYHGYSFVKSKSLERPKLHPDECRIPPCHSICTP